MASGQPYAVKAPRTPEAAKRVNSLKFKAAVKKQPSSPPSSPVKRVATNNKSSTTKKGVVPSPTLSPSPFSGVAINAYSFPHIMEDIIAYASPEALLALRTASKGMKTLVDTVLPLHVRVVQYSPPEFRNQKLAENHPVGTQKGVAMVPASETNPTRWIHRQGAAMFANREANFVEWETERAAAAVNVMKLKPEFNALMPLVIFEEQPFRRQNYVAQGREAFSFFAPFAPKPAIAKAKASLPAPSSDPSTKVAEKRFVELTSQLSTEAFNWKHCQSRQAPTTFDEIFPSGWTFRQQGSMLGRRPYIIDIVTLAASRGNYGGLRACYVRYGPFVEPGINFSAKTVVVVISLSDEVLRAFFPQCSFEPIVALRIKSGKIRHALITGPEGRLFKSVTLIISTSPTVGEGKYAPLMCSLLRDIVEVLKQNGTLTIVDVESLPLEWLGVGMNDSPVKDGSVKDKTTKAWMNSRLKAIVKEHNKSFVYDYLGRRGRGAKGSIKFEFLTKEEYMKKLGITEGEYAIRRGD